MKKKTTVLLTGLFAAVVASAAFYYLRQQTAVPAMPAIWVKTAMVKEAELPVEITAIGSLAAKTVNITPEQSGHVESLVFSDGQYVKKDSKLVKLSDESYKAKYEASLADFNYKQKNLTRMKQLGKRGLLSNDSMDEAEALLQQKRAEMQSNLASLKKMTLQAPFSGVLGKSNVSPGDYVNVGSSIVSITDIENLRVEYTVPEEYVGKLKPGQAVSVTSKAFPGKVFNATLAYISPNISVESRSIHLYATLSDKERLLKPGMLVNVKQQLGVSQHAVMVPVRSLVPVLDGEQVFKIVKDKAYAVPVTIGYRKNNEVQVLEGVAVGDQVVTDGQLKLRNGMDVKIKS